MSGSLPYRRKNSFTSNDSLRKCPTARIGSREWVEAHYNDDGILVVSREDIRKLRSTPEFQEGLKRFKEVYHRIIQKMMKGGK